jgi:iron complex transport system permease protein
MNQISPPLKHSSSAYRSRCVVHNTIYLLTALVIVCVCPWIGYEHLDSEAVLQAMFQPAETSIDGDIFFLQRLPRVILGFMVGAVLAAVGCVFQAIFRNPLATPYTLGVTGGGTVGAYLAISVPWLNVHFKIISSVQMAALVGCALVLLLIYSVATRRNGIAMTTLLLAGVTMGIICGALVLLIRYLAAPDLLVSMDRWTMGRLDIVGYRDIAFLWPLVLPGLGLLAMHIHALNQLSLGWDMALGHGVDVKAIQRHCLIGGSLATAAVVSVAGPVGFVGLIIPHTVRRISGFDHRIVLPASLLVGGAFLVLCDTLARTVLAPTEIPVGVITALVGGPFFVYILLRRI